MKTLKEKSSVYYW